MRDRAGFLAVIGVTAVLVSACGAPSTTGTGSTVTSAAPASRPTLPPRPREIDLAGVDACTLLTPAQQRQLGTDSSPVFTRYPDTYGNRRCDYGKNLSSPYFAYELKVVTQEDATVYLSGARDTAARVVSAAGFPAVQYRGTGDARDCFIGVSTKNGQYLNVHYTQSTGSDDPADVACEKARVAAEMAMQTLLTQR